MSIRTQMLFTNLNSMIATCFRIKKGLSVREFDDTKFYHIFDSIYACLLIIYFIFPLLCWYSIYVSGNLEIKSRSWRNEAKHTKMREIKHIVLVATTMAFTMEIAMTNPRSQI